MLYDNSQLACVYLHAWQVTGDEFFRTIAEEILDYVAREMTDSAGGFYSIQDADSEGEEDKFFVWAPGEIREAPGSEADASMAATVLLKLAGLTSELRTIDIAHGVLAQMESMMAQYPLGFGQWLQALGYALSQPCEIAIIGDPDSADTQALLGVVRDRYRPFQVVALGAAGARPPAIPLLQDRGLMDGQTAAYVCRAFTCQAPATEPEALRA